MAELFLYNSKDSIVGRTLVDDSDVVKHDLERYRWRIRRSHQTCYAIRYERYREIRLHNVIFGSVPDGCTVDHVNRDGLDNRRLNLRVATRSQNQQNRRVHGNSQSGVRGVYYEAATGKWRANVKRFGKRVFQGRFNSLVEAGAAVRNARQRLLTHAID